MCIRDRVGASSEVVATCAVESLARASYATSRIACRLTAFTPSTNNPFSAAATLDVRVRALYADGTAAPTGGACASDAACAQAAVKMHPSSDTAMPSVASLSVAARICCCRS